tara:strand:- start:224 stop:370 length:147 start_codon:yes stop_codon:yes gene_type:complete
LTITPQKILALFKELSYLLMAQRANDADAFTIDLQTAMKSLKDYSIAS